MYLAYETSIEEVVALNNQRKASQFKKPKHLFDLDYAVQMLKIAFPEKTKLEIIKLILSNSQGHMDEVREVISYHGHSRTVAEIIFSCSRVHKLTMRNCVFVLEWVLEMDTKQRNYELTVGEIQSQSPDGAISERTHQALCRSLLSLGIAKPIDVDHLKSLMTDKWPFLKIVQITGNVKDEDLVYLAEKAGRIQSLKVANKEVINLEQFAAWSDLQTLSITGPVVSGNMKSPKGKKLCELLELELVECSELKNYDFLAQLRKIKSLRIFYTGELYYRHFQRLFRSASKTLTKLNISFTSATRDALLLMLMDVGVRLIELRASCFSSQFQKLSIGFTGIIVARYLEWSKNTQLKTLELCRHRTINSSVFTSTPACRNSLEHMDIRETCCIGKTRESNEELLDKIRDFAFPGSEPREAAEPVGASCFPRSSKTATTLTPPPRVLNLHFSYSDAVEQVTFDRRPYEELAKSDRIVVMKFWHEVDHAFANEAEEAEWNRSIARLRRSVSRSADNLWEPPYGPPPAEPSSGDPEWGPFQGFDSTGKPLPAPIFANEKATAAQALKQVLESPSTIPSHQSLIISHSAPPGVNVAQSGGVVSQPQLEPTSASVSENINELQLAHGLLPAGLASTELTALPDPLSVGTSGGTSSSGHSAAASGAQSASPSVSPLAKCPKASVETLATTPFASVETLASTPFASLETLASTPFASLETLASTPFASLETLASTPFASVETLASTPFASLETLASTPFASLETLASTPFASPARVEALAITPSIVIEDFTNLNVEAGQLEHLSNNPGAVVDLDVTEEPQDVPTVSMTVAHTAPLVSSVKKVFVMIKSTEAEDAAPTSSY
jgi:hypothetical protein